jgi:nucleoside-diphosphate-sugar epimerase
MKVLLTGGNGFVGSHVAEALLTAGISTVLLLRHGSSREFLQTVEPRFEVRLGALDDPASLRAALHGITHVIHAAGSTKALNTAGYFAVNQQGTRALVEAANEPGTQVRRFLLVSSLAAAHPATADSPAREVDAPQPVSDYGRSKLAGEEAVRQHCRSEFIIIRPPAVYGPRDREFLRLFRAVKAGVCPRFGGGTQPLSLVYVADLAEVIVGCLLHPKAAGQTYFAAHPEMQTAASLTREIARTLHRRVWMPRLPQATLAVVCAAQEVLSQLTRRPSVVNWQKYRELVAPGWTCSPAKLAEDTGLTCPTPLQDGLARTAAWYRAAGWL